MCNFFYLKISFLVVYLILHPTISSMAQKSASADFKVDYVQAIDYLFKLKTDGEKAKVNSEILINRDVGWITLSEGDIYKCDGFNGEVKALYFMGKGKFSFTPSTEIEKRQLYRVYETENYEFDFTYLFLLFDDSTFYELVSQLNFEKYEPEKIDDKIEYCIEYFVYSNYENSRSDFLRSIMMKNNTGFFYAHFQDKRSNPVFFQINPFAYEEVSFMISRLIGVSHLREIICQFPSQEHSFSNYSSRKPDKYFLKIISYKIECTIESNLDFSAKCTIDFTSEEQEQQWIMFYLFHELEVEAVTWDDGKKAKFVNSGDSGELWIKCNKNYLDSKQHSLTISYKGDLLEKNQYGWLSLLTTYLWYPRFDNYEKVQYGLIFHTPAEYEFVSIGDLIRSSTSNDVLTTTWICKTPARFVSFNIGRFEKIEIKEKDLPDVNVFLSKYGHNQLNEWLRQNGVSSISDATEFIGHDVVNSIALFKELFGDPPINSLNISESPELHGLAFPGLIHLSWATVIQTDFEGLDEIFRAHEVAHQWWGLAVDFESYHDQWLSEGFAQYSGLWYLQQAKNNNELFFDILNEWKDEILDVREYIFGSGQEAGPIWLGYRTSSRSTMGDYDLIVYKKGAWILHMLRGMLIDLQTMNEDRMVNMMHDFFNTYKNKNASTNDFKQVADKHFGEDMSWFFNQYVYSTDIPKYKFYYTTKKSEDGKFIVTLRVKQEEVPESFKMYVPIKIILDDGAIGRIRFLVSGKETIYELPPFLRMPDEIIFNDLESVLCEVDYTTWK